MMVRRRTFLKTLAVAAAMPGAAWAEASYPARPVRIVSPFPPGGSADSIARALAERLTKNMGQGFYIENRPGAGGGIGADVVSRSAPDGYTILIGPAGAMAINKSLYKHLSYDPVNDFTPISLIGYTPILLVANPASKANTVAELIAEAKAQPGRLTFASNGNGTAHHLTAELFMQTAGIQMTHVPYNGSAHAVQDVIAGRVPYGFLDLTLCLPLIKSGRLKGIATTGLKRSASAPNVPTVAEAGLPGFDAVGWFGLFGPKNLPDTVVQTINTQAAKVLADPEFQATALTIAVDPQGSTPKELATYQAQEIEKWAKVIRVANVTIE
jgi:tripartite-type tricarboxylate transporter receptor subunit TctC